MKAVSRPEVSVCECCVCVGVGVRCLIQRDMTVVDVLVKAMRLHASSLVRKYHNS